MENLKTSNFSANNVKTYFKNQKPFSGEELFYDDYFPPNSYSLHAKDNDGNFIDAQIGEEKSAKINLAEIEWKRASEIFDNNYSLFDDKVECDDIKQGHLGNCYFLSSLAALTEYPQLITQVFKTKSISSNGYYEIVLFIDGIWQVVILDDFFPVEQGTNKLSFAKPNGNELWVILLEKAWAKVNGGYANTISGLTTDPVAAITGFTTQALEHKDYETISEELWSILLESDQSNNVMCTSTKADEESKKMGLVANHAYTLIGVKEVEYLGKTIRLVKIRNPWGYKEWNGEWSDGKFIYLFILF